MTKRLRPFVAFVISAAVLFWTPVSADTPALHLTYTEFKLPNGLTVILHEDHRVPVVTVNVWHNVGSAREHDRDGRASPICSSI